MQLVVNNLAACRHHPTFDRQTATQQHTGTMHLGIHANSMLPVSNAAHLKPHQARPVARHAQWAQPAMQHKASWLHMPPAHAHEVATRAAALEQAHSSADSEKDEEFHCFATLDLDPVAEGEYVSCCVSVYTA